MNVRLNLVKFLVEKHTHRVSHSGKTLYEHLIRCYDIAVACGFSKTQSLACGLHSIYGTDIFKSSICVTREEVKKEFSDEVEHLVYLFHSLDRRNTLWIYEREYYNRFIKVPMVLSTYEEQSLRRIELVNLLEQFHSRQFASPVVGTSTTSQS